MNSSGILDSASSVKRWGKEKLLSHDLCSLNLRNHVNSTIPDCHGRIRRS